MKTTINGIEKQKEYSQKSYDMLSDYVSNLNGRISSIENIKREIPAEQKNMNNKKVEIYKIIINAFSKIEIFEASDLIDFSGNALDYIDLITKQFISKKITESVSTHKELKRKFKIIFGEGAYSDIEKIIER